MAKYYSVDPDVFLNKTLSAVARHLEWTERLIELMQEGRELDG